MPRFFVPGVEGDALCLTGDLARHGSVLRLRPGEPITVCDGQGFDYPCQVLECTPNRLSLSVLGKCPTKSEPKVRVSIYMAYPKSDKLEHVIQKATELGAFELVAFPSSRCVVKYEEKALEKKLPRWQKIAESAAEQSGRGIIPRVVALSSFREAVARAAQADLSLCFYENEQGNTLHHALANGVPAAVSLLTGPEGGLSIEEIQTMQCAGMQICTLGSRILRCETAPLCALSAIMYAAQEY